MNAHTALRTLSCIVAVGMAAVPPLTAAQSLTVDELVERTAAHIRAYVPRLANVVCEEEYLQRRQNPTLERRLRSDFLLVHYPRAASTSGWCSATCWR